jgi:hypothetical protein
MSQLVSDRPAPSRSGSSRLPSRGSSATACNCVRHSGTGLLARMLAFPSVEDKGRPRRWTVGSARFTTSLLALTASSAIELDRPSVRQVARHQIRLFSEHRGDARPNTLGTSACMTLTPSRPSLPPEVNATPWIAHYLKEPSIRALGLLTREVLLEGAADDFTGGRLLLGGAIVESPGRVEAKGLEPSNLLTASL